MSVTRLDRSRRINQPRIARYTELSAA